MGKKIELFESTANKHEVLGYNGIVLDEYCSYCQISESLSENDFSVELDLRFPEGLSSQKVEEVEKEYAYIKYGYRTPYFLYDINNQDNAFLLEVGTKVEVLEKGEDWIKVKYNDSIGYIESVCLTNYTVETIREKIGEKTFGYTNKDYEISSIPANTRVEILDESNPYNYTIKYNEKEYTFGKQINKNVSTGYINKIKVLVDSKGYPSKNTSTTPLYTIPANTIIEYLDEYNGWVRVKYNNQISFVERVRIDRIKIGTFGIITANGGLNLRESYPSGTVLVTIPKNTKIKVLAQENGWIKTTYNNKTGWCSATYVGSITDEFREESVTQLGEKISEEIFEEIIIDTLQATREIEDVFEITNHEFAFTQTYIDKANIFERPSYDSLTDTVLDEGVVVEVLERKTTFIKVKYGNIIGWLEESKVENNFSEIVTVVTEKEDIIGKIKSILLNGSILKVKDEYNEYEIFRITNININTNNSTTTVYGRQITLEDSLRLWINSSKPTNMTGASALEKLYTDSEGRIKELTTYSNINTTDTVFIVRKNLNEAIFDDDVSFLERWGGEVERRGYNLSILKERGSDKGVVFRRGKNYTGIEEDVNQDKLVTRIIPIAFDGITLPEIYVDSPKINNYYNIFPQEIKFEEVKYKDSPNNSNKEGFDTLEEVYAELRKQASEYFTNNKCDELRGVYNIKVVDVSSTEEYKELSIFEKTWIGDTVTIIDEKLNLNIKARVTKRKFDVIKGMRSETEVTNITSRRSSLSLESLQNQINNIQTPEVPDIDLIIQQAKKEAEEFIRNGITDSYVVLKENEILIMDTNNVDTAVKILRMNKHGIAGSTTGYNGSFNLAMTIDGQIVADRISTGVLNASLIKAGTLMSANGKSWLNMENGTFNFSDKIKFDGNEFNVSFSDVQELNETFEGINSNISGLNTSLSVLRGEMTTKVTSEQAASIAQQTVNGFKQEVVQTYPTNESVSNAFSDLDKNLQNNYATKTLVTQTADSITQTVSKKVGKNEIISSINQTAETIQIQANKINLDGYVWVGTQLTAPHITGKVQMYMETGSIFSSDGEMNVKRFYGMPNGTFNVESTATFSKQIYGKSTGIFDGNLTCKAKLISNTGAITRDFSVGALLTAQNFTLSNNASIGGTCYCNSQETTYDSSVGRNLVVNNNTRTKTLSVTGDSTLNALSTATITNTGNATIRGTLTAQNQTINNNLTVSRNIYANAGEISTSLTIGGTVYANGNVNIQKHLWANSLAISGSKNCVQETENYGKRLINAYETCDYYFGDIGESQTINGESTVWIDDIFKEIISTEVDYQVFITKYGKGDIWVEERTQDYFVVKSENDINFGWEIKGKRKGYEKYRLEEYKEDK